jgi:uncharacterized protein YkwD
MKAKKGLALFLTIVMCVGMLVTEPMAVKAETLSVPVQVTYGQSEAREMLRSINSFRTSSTEAWAYDASGKKVSYKGLSELVYDYDLEQVAMKRAAEIALSYSHTRPNGQRCFTAYNYTDGAHGENIAAGYSSGNAVFVGWREDNEDYNGQGHRRNMLSERFTAIGIGHVKYQGIDYWVQEFSSIVTEQSDSGVNDSTTLVNVEVDDSYILGMDVTESSISLKKGETLDLSDLGVKLKIQGYWSYKESSCLTCADYKASVADSSIAVYDNYVIKGVSVGKTTLKVSAFGKSVKLPVTVTAAPTSKELKASVALTATSKTIKKGKTYQINFKKTLEKSYVSKITYTSSDKKIATVSKTGKVTAKKKGSAEIKCKVVFDGGASKTVKLKVTVK